MSDEASTLVEDILFMQGVKKDLETHQMAELDIAVRAVNSAIDSMNHRLNYILDNEAKELNA